MLAASPSSARSVFPLPAPWRPSSSSTTVVLGRIIESKDGQEFLGFERIEGTLQTSLPLDEVVKGLGRVARDLASGTIKVDDIKTKEKRAQYFKELQTLYPEDIPDLSLRTEERFRIDQPLDETTAATRRAAAEAATGESAGGADAKRKTRERSPSHKRTKLIPPSFRIRITHDRVNNVYKELRDLNVDKYPNCVGVMFRVFLELSVDHYIKKHSVPGKGKHLNERMSAVAKHMISLGMSSHDAFPIERLAASATMMAKDYHAYVHNLHYTPKPSELKTTWDDIQPFIEKLWE